MVLNMTSDTHSQGEMFDTASSIVQQKISQISGVGQVQVVGSSLPAVRVDLNPQQLNSYGLGPQDVARVLSGQNSNRPKGQLSDDSVTADITANDQISKARGLCAHRDWHRYQNGSIVRLRGCSPGDVIRYQTTRSAGFANGKPSVVLLVYRLPNANAISTTDRIIKALPALNASIPAGDKLAVAINTTTTIRASVKDVEIALGLSILLVVAVVFVFLRSPQATLVPGVAVTGLADRNVFRDVSAGIRSTISRSWR